MLENEPTHLILCSKVRDGSILPTQCDWRKDAVSLGKLLGMSFLHGTRSTDLEAWSCVGWESLGSLESQNGKVKVFASKEQAQSAPFTISGTSLYTI